MSNKYIYVILEDDDISILTDEDYSDLTNSSFPVLLKFGNKEEIKYWLNNNDLSCYTSTTKNELLELLDFVSIMNQD